MSNIASTGRTDHTPAASRPVSSGRQLAHRVLSHKAAVAVKRPLKDLLWAVRGIGLTNPAIHRDVKAALFLCKGNICRSPFAAVRMAALLRDAGLEGIRCASAGFATKAGTHSPREAVQSSARFGVALASHKPVQLSRELVAEFDLIVVMEAAHRDLFRRTYPEARAAIVLLPLMLDGWGYERYNIADPYGQSVETFDWCYVRIDRALRALAAAIRLAKAG